MIHKMFLIPSFFILEQTRLQLHQILFMLKHHIFPLLLLWIRLHIFLLDVDFPGTADSVVLDSYLNCYTTPVLDYYLPESSFTDSLTVFQVSYKRRKRVILNLNKDD